jgi:hypothetical protein
MNPDNLFCIGMTIIIVVWILFPDGVAKVVDKWGE